MINNIGIIGGTGQMGQMFTQHFKKIGKTVRISDEKTQSDEKDLVLNSELIIISVPIDLTAMVVKRIKPWLKKDQLLSDFTSVKNKAIPAMIETDAAIISCHPVFGGMENISGQNIVLLPVVPGKFLSKYKRLYQELLLNVIIMDDWKKHDESMSFIQGLMHFQHIVFTQTLKAKNVDLETILSMCSPVYQANFAFACRIIQRDPHLYTHILMDNPENIQVLSKFIDEASKSLKLIQKKDETAFQKNFLGYREYLGKFGTDFNEQSEYLVTKLREYNQNKSQE
jgi:chorismate mutase / prephenate dehydrogenase